MRESRGILGSSKVTEKFWSFEQDVDIFSHLGATLGTSQEPAVALSVCVTLRSKRSSWRGWKISCCKWSSHGGCCSRGAFSIFLGVESKSCVMSVPSRKGKKLETKDERRNVLCAAPLALPSLKSLGDTGWFSGFLGATTLKETHFFPSEPGDVWGVSCLFWDSHRYIKRRKSAWRSLFPRFLLSLEEDFA